LAHFGPQVDFVGYVANPFFRRGAPRAEAAAQLAALRNVRQKRRGDRPSSADSTLARLAASGQEGGARRLPKGYRYVEIKQSAAKLKFEEFDFSYYNRTRFAGLENDMANSYCNALLQVCTC
jgi:PAB-dependent poly(A)-specific ribonuclease subunit 2